MAKSVAAKDVKKIVYACEAGMGSSLIGANQLKKKLKNVGLQVEVEHSPLEELREANGLVEDIRAELDVPPVEVGIMIEVPAAALLAEVLAQEVDFFSIGTNDLTQYAMAMDRTHPLLAKQADGLHPAVLRLVDRTVRGAHAADKWVGICGELAADPEAVPILVGLGMDELSVNVPAVPIVKAQVRSLSFAKVQKLAAEALICGTAAEVRGLSASSIDI